MIFNDLESWGIRVHLSTFLNTEAMPLENEKAKYGLRKFMGFKS